MGSGWLSDFSGTLEEIGACSNSLEERAVSVLGLRVSLLELMGPFTEACCMQIHHATCTCQMIQNYIPMVLSWSLLWRSWLQRATSQTGGGATGVADWVVVGLRSWMVQHFRGLRLGRFCVGLSLAQSQGLTSLLDKSGAGYTLTRSPVLLMKWIVGPPTIGAPFRHGAERFERYRGSCLNEDTFGNHFCSTVPRDPTP